MLIPLEEMQSFLTGIATHSIELVAECDPQEVYAGNVQYRASNGWSLVVFNDANEYDYVETIATTDGRTIDLDDLSAMPVDWNPDAALAWKCFGIPGYCIFRCTVCGARIPDGIERRRRMIAPFLCGDVTCVGKQSPPNGTWVRVRP